VTTHDRHAKSPLEFQNQLVYARGMMMGSSPAEGFIEKQDLGVHGQCTGNRGAFLHAARSSCAGM